MVHLARATCTLFKSGVKSLISMICLVLNGGVSLWSSQMRPLISLFLKGTVTD